MAKPELKLKLPAWRSSIYGLCGQLDWALAAKNRTKRTKTNRRMFFEYIRLLILVYNQISLYYQRCFATISHNAIYPFSNKKKLTLNLMILFASGLKL